MCVRDGTEKCANPEKNVPCGWCLMMAACPQAKKKLEVMANSWKRD